MPYNIEIKARVADRPGLEKTIARLADTGPESIFQDDTFFNCPRGRLKLRVLSANDAQLIHYHRPDQVGPKKSDYRITPVSDPDGIREVLHRAFGISGRIVKRRTLFIIGQTRAHLDVVEKLGDFLELEVVLRDNQSERQGTEIANELLNRLDVTPDQLVDCAYIDLVQPMVE